MRHPLFSIPFLPIFLAVRSNTKDMPHVLIDHEVFVLASAKQQHVQHTHATQNRAHDERVTQKHTEMEWKK